MIGKETYLIEHWAVWVAQKTVNMVQILSIPKCSAPSSRFSSIVLEGSRAEEAMAKQHPIQPIRPVGESVIPNPYESPITLWAWKYAICRYNLERWEEVNDDILDLIKFSMIPLQRYLVESWPIGCMKFSSFLLPYTRPGRTVPMAVCTIVRKPGREVSTA